MSKFTLSEKDNEKIKQAVNLAESKTSGEIVTAIIKESSDYAFYELLAALAGGFIYYLVCLFLYNDITSWLNDLFWSYTEVYSTTFIGLSTIIVIGLIYLVANIEGFDRLIVPKKIISKKVNRRALLFFGESGLFDTRDRTGVLIFISLREKRVELIADTGINAMVKEDDWSGVVSDLISHLKKKKMIDGLAEAVDSCGNILAEHFPIKDDDENELSDEVHILED